MLKILPSFYLAGRGFTKATYVSRFARFRMTSLRVQDASRALMAQAPYAQHDSREASALSESLATWRRFSPLYRGTE